MRTIGPVFGQTKPYEPTIDAEKLQTLRKHTLVKPLKSLAIIWI